MKKYNNGSFTVKKCVLRWEHGKQAGKVNPAGTWVGGLIDTAVGAVT